MSQHLIAIVGRPNVGKSTLFNRLARRWKSIVEDRPGITRDRIYGDATLYGNDFKIMDTGGLNLHPKTKMDKKVSLQAEKGLEEADLLLFVMDGRAGPTDWDREWVAKLRKIRTPKVFVINKIDEPALDGRVQEFHELGIAPFVSISSETMRNFSGLSEAILKALKLEKKSDEDFPELQAQSDEIETLPDDPEAREAALDAKYRGPLNIAIIGRPNVGKSTLLNAILDDDRSIVDDVPGTTRDPIHTYVERGDKQYCFVDTAGIRKRAKTLERVEKFSVVNSLGVIDTSHMVLLLLDSAVGPTEQDAHVAGYAFEKQKAIVVVANKWDEGSKKYTREKFKEMLELKLNYLNYCPLIFISAKTRKNLPKVFEAIDALREQYETKIKTSQLNKAFEDIIHHHPLPTFKGRDINMYYATQVGRRPPAFMIFCSNPDNVHFTYKRYLINAIRDRFELHNVPIRLLFKKR